MGAGLYFGFDSRQSRRAADAALARRKATSNGCEYSDPLSLDVTALDNEARRSLTLSIVGVVVGLVGVGAGTALFAIGIEKFCDGSYCGTCPGCYVATCGPRGKACVRCDDGNECTIDKCDLMADIDCVHAAVIDGTSCSKGAGVCSGGQCKVAGTGGTTSTGNSTVGGTSGLYHTDFTGGSTSGVSTTGGAVTGGRSQVERGGSDGKVGSTKYEPTNQGGSRVSSVSITGEAGEAGQAGDSSIDESERYESNPVGCGCAVSARRSGGFEGLWILFGLIVGWLRKRDRR